MSDSESDNPPKNNPPVTLSAEQFAEFMRLSMSQKNQNQQPSSVESLGEVRLAEKLNGDNYPLWAKLMSRGIRGKGLASHISGVPDPPPPTDPNYNRWQQRDDCCFNWIINNIDASLVNEVSQYETAYDLWDSLATTYGSGADQFQISDLHRQAYNIKQGESSLENLWQRLQDLWISIDTRDPNPMDTPSSIEKYNLNTQRHRLYQFMWALDDHRYNKIKREILNMDPIPTARKAYGLVRRESVNEKLLNLDTKEPGIGSGLAMFNRNRAQTPQHQQPLRNPNYQKDEDKSKLVCNHCGGKRHTRETCFHIHGFPEWWEEMKRAKQARNGGRNGGGRGGGRASATVSYDRVTNTENPVGSSGGSGINSGGGEAKTEGNPIIGSASIARTWSEGNGFQNGIITGGGCGEKADTGGARVPTGVLSKAARVPENHPQIHHIYPQLSLNSKTPPTNPIYQKLPHPEKTFQYIPQNFPKSQNSPHPENNQQKHTQTSNKFQIDPLLGKTLQVAPRLS